MHGGASNRPTDFRLIGRVPCLDGVTRDVYEDSDGRQWVTGTVGRLYGLWVPKKDKQAPRAEANAPNTPPPTSSPPVRGAVWFALLQGQESGPFTADELAAKVAAGTVGPEHLVRKGKSGWAPVKGFRFLADYLPTKSPPASRETKATEKRTDAPTGKGPADTSPQPPAPPAPNSPASDAGVWVPKKPNHGLSTGQAIQGILVICGFTLLLSGGCIYGVGGAISSRFNIPLWLCVVSFAVLEVSIILLLLSPTLLKDRREKLENERKKAEQEAWLRTPQGMAWQDEERDKQRKQEEENERRRKEAEESAARAKWRVYYESKTMDEISKMSGTQFEEFLARLFSRMDYREINLTPTNDQGGDLLCLSPNGVRLVIQAKRWSGTVGNSAVQELLGAMLHYDRDEGMVVTNSTLTVAACELAKKNPRITLRDGRWLAEQIKKFLPPEIPEFSWEEYNSVVKDYQPPRAGASRRIKSRRSRRRRWY